jgi:hypothetical protein
VKITNKSYIFSKMANPMQLTSGVPFLGRSSAEQLLRSIHTKSVSHLQEMNRVLATSRMPHQGKRLCRSVTCQVIHQFTKMQRKKSKNLESLLNSAFLEKYAGPLYYVPPLLLHLPDFNGITIQTTISKSKIARRQDGLNKAPT